MKTSLEKILKNFFDKYFKNQHPETALRYLPIVSVIKRKGLQDTSILEVGSGSLGITPFLKKPIDGLDVDFSGPQTKLLTKIKGSAFDLPMRKNSYDVVISVDTLEHIPKNQREKSIYEMIRASKRLVVIVVPTGKLAELQDQNLEKYFQKVFGEKDQFLEEHVQNGLPQNDEILVGIDKSLRQLSKKAVISSRPLLNLAVRNLLMHTWISKNKYVYYTYMKGYLLLLPILRFANFGNCYRRMFVIELAS